jgi:PiT family inorganic phosphate transporter
MAETYRKPTLDKDLDKLATMEEATGLLNRGFVTPGLAIIFIFLCAIIAAVFVTGQPGAVTIIAAAMLGAYMALNIGANDVANNVGPAVGSQAIDARRAGHRRDLRKRRRSDRRRRRGRQRSPRASSIRRGVRPQCLHLGDDGSAGLVRDVGQSRERARRAGFDHPFVVGGVMGAGIAAAGVDAVNWPTMGAIAASWVISPFWAA